MANKPPLTISESAIEANASLTGLNLGQSQTLRDQQNASPHALAKSSGATAISKETSARLRSLRLPLAIGIVFAHSSGISVTLAQGKLNLVEADFFGLFFRALLSDGIARSSVPISLLMAGFLLAIGFDSRMSNYLQKLKTKLRTLLIPFLFWNIFVVGLYALAHGVQPLSEFMSGKNGLIAQYSLSDFFSAVLGIGRAPIAYQFWFIRDLMILCVLSPLLLHGLKRWPSILLTLLGALWLSDLWPIAVPSSRAILFFSVGLYLGATDKSGTRLFALDPYARPLAVLYCLLLVVNALSSAGGQPHRYLHEAMVAIGIPVWLYASKLALNVPSLHRWLITYSSASFFVFAAHEPLLTALIKVVFRAIAPVSSLLGTVLYLAIPLTLIGVLVYVHQLMSKRFPTMTHIITGGRR